MIFVMLMCIIIIILTFVVLTSMTKPCAVGHLGPLNESWSVPGGRQLVGKAENLSYESICRPNVHPSLFVSLLSHSGPLLMAIIILPSHGRCKAELT